MYNYKMKTATGYTIQIFWKHAKKYYWLVSVLALATLTTVATEIVSPIVYRQLINAVSERMPVTRVYQLVLLVLLIGVIYNIGQRVASFATTYFEAKVQRDLVRTAYSYVLHHSVGFFSDTFVGGLIAKINRFDRSFERLADEFIWGMGRTSLLLGLTLVVLAIHIPLAALVMGVWVILYLVAAYFFNQYKMPYELQNAEQDSLVTAHMADTITNVTTIKLFTSEKSERSTFQKITEKQFKIQVFTWNLSNYYEIAQAFFALLLEAAIFLIAVWLWNQGRLTVGDFVLLQLYINQIVGNLWNISRNIRALYRGIADANEMSEILLTPYGVTDKINAKKLKVPSGSIQFDKLGFAYEGQSKVFNNFNLSISSGERVALVGPSGGGKTTIVKLLFRFYDVTNGGVSIDGQNIGDVTQESLRENISLVPQDPILFHRSLLDNIKYAKPNATFKEVVAAAKAAHCHEFIDKLPNKYDTMVGERGVKLSGGERQRVAIARAILKNAPILVLDEATSSLDSESENLIQDALKTLMHGKTTIVIAHRLSTIMAMDRIVVIEGGKITEQGKHEELLKAQDGKYQKLWHIQSGSYQND